MRRRRRLSKKGGSRISSDLKSGGQKMDEKLLRRKGRKDRKKKGRDEGKKEREKYTTNANRWGVGISAPLTFSPLTWIFRLILERSVQFRSSVAGNLIKTFRASHRRSRELVQPFWLNGARPARKNELPFSLCPIGQITPN